VKQWVDGALLGGWSSLGNLQRAGFEIAYDRELWERGA